MIRPRFVARLWARMCGYFWLPCPRCGRMFAGNEGTGTGVPTADKFGFYKTACARCVVELSVWLAEQEAAWGMGFAPRGRPTPTRPDPGMSESKKGRSPRD